MGKRSVWVLCAIWAGCTNLGPGSMNQDVADGGGADARSQITDASSPDAPGGCLYQCQVDFNEDTSTCQGGPIVPTVLDYDQRRGQMATPIDMAAASGTELLLTVEICDEDDFTLHVGDSPGNDGGGNDGGQSSNDAEIQIENRSLEIFASDYGNGARLLEQDGHISSGCESFTWTVGDRSFHTTQTGTLLQNDNLLRLDPPMDDEGTPDSLWFVGLNRSYASNAGSRNGRGVETAHFCIR